MSDERKQYIRIALGYNCLMLAMALAAYALSIWLLLSGRLFREGIDAKFLFAVGLVLGTSFLTVQALAIRDGWLSDLRELGREEAGRYMATGRPRRAWQQSHVH